MGAWPSDRAAADFGLWSRSYTSFQKHVSPLIRRQWPLNVARMDKWYLGSKIGGYMCMYVCMYICIDIILDVQPSDDRLNVAEIYIEHLLRGCIACIGCMPLHITSHLEMMCVLYSSCTSTTTAIHQAFGHNWFMILVLASRYLLLAPSLWIQCLFSTLPERKKKSGIQGHDYNKAKQHQGRVNKKKNPPKKENTSPINLGRIK